jgi:ATP-binding cassette subfamily B protein
MSERPLAELAFRHGDLVDALEAAAITSGLTRQRPPRSVELAVPPTGDRRAVATLLDRLGARLGIEVEEVEISAAELAGSLAEICPALIELPGEERRWLVVLGAAGGRVRVLDASYGVRTIRRAALVDTLIRPAATPSEQEADALVMAAGLTGRRSLRARRALVAAGLRHAPVAGLWLLRAPASRPLREQATRAGLRGRVTLLLLTQLVISGLWLSAWWIVGRTTLGGIGDPGWLSGWALCLAALVPARALVVWLQGALSFELGALLRRRLLAGALAIDPERTKADGLGRLLGLVMECDALESLGTSGGATVILSIVELAPVPFALAAGAAGWLHVALLALWLVPFGLVIRRQLRDRMAWTEQRLHLTQSLVDNMIGHRTRLAQMPRERWHAGEDRALTDYDAVSTRYDRVRLALLHFLARGWLVVAVGALIPEVAGHASPGALAISIGAVLYAHASFERLASGMGQLTAAIESWGGGGAGGAPGGAGRTRRRTTPARPRSSIAPPRPPAGRSSRPTGCRSATPGARTCSVTSISRSAPAIASCSRARPAPASRPWRRCSARSGDRTPASSCSISSTSTPSASIAGASASRWCRSSTRTT